MDLLHDALLSVTPPSGRPAGRMTLPGLLAALVREEVGDFPALRPHQRHVWHAFLVQIGALGTLDRAAEDLPVEEDA